jgi:hypothetical protein
MILASQRTACAKACDGGAQSFKTALNNPGANRKLPSDARTKSLEANRWRPAKPTTVGSDHSRRSGHACGPIRCRGNHVQPHVVARRWRRRRRRLGGYCAGRHALTIQRHVDRAAIGERAIPCKRPLERQCATRRNNRKRAFLCEPDHSWNGGMGARLEHWRRKCWRRRQSLF